MQEEGKVYTGNKWGNLSICMDNIDSGMKDFNKSEVVMCYKACLQVSRFNKYIDSDVGKEKRLVPCAMWAPVDHRCDVMWKPKIGSLKCCFWLGVQGVWFHRNINVFFLR